MEYYLYLKALHLVFIFIWISMLVYSTRLLSYHLEAIWDKNESLIKRIELEEKMIYRYFISPSFILAITFGISLIVLNSSLLSSGIWIYIKFFLISLLAIVHHLCKIYMAEFEDENIDISLNKKKFNYLTYSIFVCISLIVLLTIVKMI